MSPLPAGFKRRLFWVVSRICFTGYKLFPIFGRLRAAIGIIHRDGRFLVIDRNDGRGLSLPGGLSSWREPEESTLRREVHEETGLEVIGLSLKTRYPSKAELPCFISVFDVQVSGEIRESWEGRPRWKTIEEIENRLLKSQQPVIELMKEMLGRRIP